MTANLTYPGVYIEEIPSGVRTIVGIRSPARSGGAQLRALISRDLIGVHYNKVKEDFQCQ